MRIALIIGFHFKHNIIIYFHPKISHLKWNCNHNILLKIHVNAYTHNTRRIMTSEYSTIHFQAQLKQNWNILNYLKKKQPSQSLITSWYIGILCNFDDFDDIEFNKKNPAVKKIVLYKYIIHKIIWIKKYKPLKKNRINKITS